MGRPLFQGSPLLKNSPLDYFSIHPVRSARGKEISLTAVSDKGAALDLQAFFTRKGLTEKPVNIGSAFQQSEIPERYKGRS